jgi:protein SCO1/2
MWNDTRLSARTTFLFAAIAAAIIVSVGIAGCSSPKPAEQPPAPHRYALSGTVISIDKPKNQVVVDGADIPGFMMAMTMGYDIKPVSQLDSLTPGDQITADVVVNGNDVWLENTAVVKKAGTAAAPASKDSHPAGTPPGKQ